MLVKVGDFGVPKFKLDFSSGIAEILKQLGLVLPFGLGSDLSGMVEDDGTGFPLVVQEVIHKAVIEVNEEGTEAAALTTPFLPPGFDAGILLQRHGRRLADGSPDDNLVFSPLSIHAALALLAAGARGATLDEILRVLGARSRNELEHFVSRMAADALQDRSASGGPRVAFACGVWSDLTRRLKPAFRDAVVGRYKAEASSVDFRGAPEAARSQINAWAAQETRNLIDSVLPATRVVLGNAMYFRGKWEDEPFDKAETAHKPFHWLDRSQVYVPFMKSWESQFVAVHDGFKVLKLRTTWPEQQIALGEFRCQSSLCFHSSVVAVLKKLGLELPFRLEGDLSGMVEDDGSGLPILVDDVIHKAVVEVNEEGTEAAAVSLVMPADGCAAGGWSSPPPQVDFIADHPFALLHSGGGDRRSCLCGACSRPLQGAVEFDEHILFS
ncbi:hypothetical protein ZWY2020_018332 [Hordeum vulgare]|nr:hypothetical protein ZWY2020_018332 [Hordeum vulgare]